MHAAPESRMELVPRLKPSSSDYSHPELSDFSNIRSSTCFVLQLYCGQVEVLIQLVSIAQGAECGYLQVKSKASLSR